MNVNVTEKKKDILRHLKLLLLTDGISPDNQPVIDFHPSILYLFDPRRKRLAFMNADKITEHLGFEKDEISTIEESLDKFVYKDDLEMVKNEIAKFTTLDDDDDYSYDCRLNHKEGDWRYFRTRGTVVRRTPDGKPESMIFIAEDITEISKNEKEVTALRRLLDDTEDLLLFGSWSWDLQVDRMYWTDNMYKLLEYEKEDVAHEVSLEFYLKHISGSGAELLLDRIREGIKNKMDFECKYTVVTKRKNQIIISTKGKIITDPRGEVVKVVGISRDITRQTKINLDLSHYKEMIAEKEEFLNQGSWETDLENGETTWSKGMYSLFGYDPDQFIGRLEVTNELHFKHMDEEEVKKSKEDWLSIINSRDNYIREATIFTNDGQVKRLETYGKVIRDTNGKAEKVIGTTRDVSQLKEYERSLETKIQELNRSNTELEEFSYVASHDLQEPLRKLTTFSERLQSKFSECLGKEGNLYLSRIVAATESMRVLIENLLEFSRTARSARHFTRMNLGALLEEVKQDLELKIEETGTIVTAGPLPVIDVIPSQLKQLFDNLLSNSIKFRKPDQSCTISITSDKLTNPDKILYNLRADITYFQLVVKDNGIGFEKEYAERIFQIFQRLHGKSEYPGSGIGLAICKKIVENHQGMIFASGELGVGAVFTIILPENQTP